MALDLSSPLNSPVLMVCELSGAYRPAMSAEVMHVAQQMLFEQIRGREVLNSPQVVRDFLRVRLGCLEHEVFAVLMLDAQHRLIEYVELFRGTVTQTSVYPREVVKEALARNAAALFLVHNHPSGEATPSRADGHLTETLQAALKLVDVRVIDHLVVTGTAIHSFAEHGAL